MNKMKRLTALITAIVMLAGCGVAAESDSDAKETNAASSAVQEESKSEDPAEETEKEDSEAQDIDYIELARTLSKDFIEGNYSSLTELLSDTAAKSLDENTLALGMMQINAMAGEYKDMGDSRIEENGDYTIVTTLLYFEKMNVDMAISFGSGTTVIEGLSLLPAQEEITAQDTDTFTETEIKIGEYALDGMLTMPKGVDAPPVVILIQGTGATDMNEDLAAAKPFYDIAHGLAEQGIATIRYNKRFYQYPELGEDADVTIDDEVLDDADAAVKFAQSLVNEGKASKVYVLGHSLGGMLVPIIADRNSEVRGIISLAGTPRKLEVVLIEQLTALLDQTDGQTREQIEKFIEQAEILRDKKEYVPNDNPPSLQAMFGAAYWISLGELEPAETADKLDIPMLFLQGDQDTQVYPDRDFPAWKEKLEDNSNCEFILYEGLGHIFADNDNKVDSRVIDDIADFVNKS